MKHKMDRHLIATNQPYEIEYVIKKLAKEGLTVSKADVLKAIKAVGRSRRKVYAALRVTNQ